MDKLSIDTIRQYLSHLEQNGHSNEIIARKLNSTLEFIRWAYHNDFLKYSQFQQIKDEIANFEVKYELNDLRKAQNTDGIATTANSAIKDQKIAPMTSLWHRLRNKISSTADSADASTSTSKLTPQYYLGMAFVVLIIAILGAGIYERFLTSTDKSFAYPSSPSAASRILSFQGRLTDSLGNPITAATNMRFRLYTASSGGTTLYDTGTCSITPDQDGVHNVLIGSDCGSEIASSVFTENTQVWLGVLVGSDAEMTPRQRIANVPYAINAETLQGLPVGTEVSTIPYINAGGDLLMAAASPQIGSTYTNQDFLLSSARAITIQSAGSGDVTLTATESGTIKFATGGTQHGLITNTGLFGIGTTGPDAKLDVLYTGGEQLRLTYTDGSNYTAFTTDSGGDLTINPSGDDITFGGDLILADTFTAQIGGKTGTAYNAFANSSDAPESGSISSDNDVYIGGDLEVDGSIIGTINPGFTQGSVVFADGSGNLAQDNSSLFFDDTNNLVGIGTAAPLAKLHVTGAATGKALSIFNETGDQNIITASASGTTVANLDRSGNLSIEGAISDLGGTTLTVNDNLDVSGTLFSGTGDAFQVDTSGNITAVGTTLSGDIAVNGGDITSTASTFNLSIANAGTINFRDGSNTLVAIKDQGVYPFLNLAGKTDTGDPGTCAEGDVYYNDTDDTIKICHESNTWEALDGGAVATSWTDSGTTVYLTDTTDELVIGGSTPLSSSKVSIDGDADQIQLIVQGNGTQTADLAVFENSSGTDLLNIDEYGALVTNPTITTAQNTVDINATYNASTNSDWTATNFDSVHDISGFVSINMDTIALRNNLDVYTGNASNGFTQITGEYTTVDVEETSGADAVYGNRIITTWNSSGTAANIYGSSTTITESAGSVTNAYGYYTNLTGAGATDSYGFYNAGGEYGFYNANTSGNYALYSTGGVAFLDRALDSIGLQIRGHSTQTNHLTIWEHDDGSDLAWIDGTGNMRIGTSAPDTGKLNVTGADTGKALVILNETGDQDIIAASASGTTRFRVSNDGTVYGGYFADISNTAYGIDPAGTSNFGGYSMKITGGALLAVDSGNVGIGDQTPDAKLNVLSTTEQLRLDYDDSNYTSFTVSSGGDLTIAPTGSDTNVTGNLAISGGTTLGDASGDTVSVNADAWTFANDTTVALTGGLNGLNFDSNTLSIDGANDRVGIGTAAPASPLEVSVSSNNVTSIFNIANTAASGGDKFAIDTYGDSTGLATSLATNLYWNNGSDARFSGSHSAWRLWLDNRSGADYTKLHYMTTGGTLYTPVTINGGTYDNALYIGSTGNVGFGTNGPDAKVDSLATSGEQLRLTYTDGSAYTGFTVGSGGDLTLDSTGGDIIFANADVLNIGGNADDVAFSAIGDDTANAGNVNSDNDLYIEDDLEVDGTIFGNISGTIGTGFTQGSVTFADSSGNLAQDNTNFFWDDSSNELGIGDTTPDAFLDITGTTAQLRLSYETGDTNYTSFTTSSGGDLTIAPSGGDLAVTGDLDVSDQLAAGANGAITANEIVTIANSAVPVDTSGTTGLSVTQTETGSGSSSAGHQGIYNYLANNSSSTGNISNYGIKSDLYNQNAAVGTNSAWRNFFGFVKNEATANISTYNYYALSQIAATTTASTLTNFYSSMVNGSATGTTMYGYYAASPTNASGSITTSYGMRIDDQSVGTNTTAYGLYIASQAGASGDNVGLYIADSEDYSIQLASTDGDAASGITFGTDTNLYRNGANTLHTDDNFDIDGTLAVDGNTTLVGDLAVNGDDITADGALTLNSASYVRVGDSGTPGSANGDDDLYVEGDLEIDGVMYLDGTVDTSFTAGSIVFAGTSGVLAQDNTNFFWDDSSNELGIGDTTPDAFLDITGTTEQLRLSYETGDTNYTSFTTSSGGDLTIAPSGGDTNITGNIAVTGNTGLGNASTDVVTVTGNQVINFDTASSNQNGLYINSSQNTATGGTLRGLNVGANFWATSGTQTGVNGLDFTVQASGNGGTVTTMKGISAWGVVGTGATVGTFKLVDAANPTNSGTVTSLSGFSVDNLTSGTNNTLILAGTSSIPSGNWGIYNSSSYSNYFSGTTGIGTTGADAKLDVLSTTEQLRLTYSDGSTYTGFTVSSGGDLTINATGSQVLLADADTLNIGGITGAAYNAISDSGTTSHSLASDDDLFIEGDLEVDTLAFFDGNVTLGNAASDTVTITADVASNILPSANDTYTLGSSSERWADLYLGPASLHIGSSGNEGIIGYDTTNNWIEFNPTGDASEEFRMTDTGNFMLIGDISYAGEFSGVDGYGDSGSLIANGSLELDLNSDTEPDGWDHDTGSHNGTISSSSSYNGDYHYRIDAETAENGFQTSCFPVSDAQTYYIDLYAKAASGTLSHMDINYIEYSSRANCEADSAAGVGTVTGGLATTTSWAEFGGSYSPDTGALWLKFEIENNDTSGATNQDLYIDAVRVWYNSTNGAGGLDLAETYPVDKHDDIELGQIVSFGTEEQQNDADVRNIKKSSGAYDKNAFGITATQPGIVLDDNGTYNKVQVALKGRVPVLVTSENGPIKIGDPITASSKPGIGMKATKSGRIIGYAMTELKSDDPDEIDQVIVFVNPETYVDLSILTSLQESVAQLPSLSASALTRADDIVINAADAVLLKTEHLFAQSITAVNATIDNLIVDRIVSREITAQTIDVETINAEKVTAENIAAETITAKEATFSGKLVAQEIDADNIRELRDRLERLAADNDTAPKIDSAELQAEVESIQQYLEELPDQDAQNLPLNEIVTTTSIDPGTTTSISGDQITMMNVEKLMVTGEAAMTSLVVADSFTAGNIFIKDNSVLSLSNELKLSALEQISLMDGAVIIAKNGTITAKGEVIAEKGVRTNTIKPLDENSNIGVQLSQNKVEVLNNDAIVAAIDNNGSAKFRDVSVDTYTDATSSAAIIAATDNYEANGIFSPGIQTNAAAAGNGILPAGNDTVVVFNDKVGPHTLVYVTATSKTYNQNLYVAEKKVCTELEKSEDNCKPYFTVHIDGAVKDPITFNWWTVN